MNDILKQVYWNNTIETYLIVVAELVVVWIIFRLFKRYIISVLKKITSRTESQFDDALVAAAEKFILPFVLLTVSYGIIEQLHFTTHTERVFKVVIAVITTYFFIRFINYALHLSLLLYMRRREEPPQREKQLNGILLVVKACVWIAGILMLIENLGYNITTIITGLGIGGIAIALAAQNILTDLFSYFVIFFDKPFEIGDMISVNNVTGTVERIGIKTSHIRSVAGEQLIMPNADLVKSTIKNIKRLERRGVTFKLNVRYDTTSDKLKSLPDLIKLIIEKQEFTTFDRCHLIAFGDFSLSYEILYFINSSDYKTYLNIQQNIYYGIMHGFSEQGIDFAFPGQTFILQHPLNQDQKKTKLTTQNLNH